MLGISAPAMDSQNISKGKESKARIWGINHTLILNGNYDYGILLHATANFIWKAIFFSYLCLLFLSMEVGGGWRNVRCPYLGWRSNLLLQVPWSGWKKYHQDTII